VSGPWATSTGPTPRAGHHSHVGQPVRPIHVLHHQEDGFVTNIVNGRPMGDQSLNLFRASLKWSRPRFRCHLDLRIRPDRQRIGRGNQRRRCGWKRRTAARPRCSACLAADVSEPVCIARAAVSCTRYLLPARSIAVTDRSDLDTCAKPPLNCTVLRSGT